MSKTINRLIRRAQDGPVRGPLRDSFMELARRFPPRPIHNERQYDQTVKVMNALAVRDERTLDAGERDYLETLAMHVEAYDREHYDIDLSDVTPLELLKHIMENRGMRVSDLGRLIGSQALASMILAGKRQISRQKAKLLAQHFALDPGVFL